MLVAVALQTSRSRSSSRAALSGLSSSRQRVLMSLTMPALTLRSNSAGESGSSANFQDAPVGFQRPLAEFLVVDLQKSFGSKAGAPLDGPHLDGTRCPRERRKSGVAFPGRLNPPWESGRRATHGAIPASPEIDVQQRVCHRRPSRRCGTTWLSKIPVKTRPGTRDLDEQAVARREHRLERRRTCFDPGGHICPDEVPARLGKP